MAFTTAQLMGALLTVDGRATEGGIIDIPPGARLLLDVISEGQQDGDLLAEIGAALDTAAASATSAAASAAAAKAIADADTADDLIAALDADPASALRIQQDIRLAGTYVTQASLTPAIDARAGFFISLKSAGAKGDGVTDDTAALKQVIDSAGTQATTFFLPPGNYLISDTLVLKARQRILGAGKYVSTITQPASATALNAKPLISGPVVSSADTTTTTSYDHIGIEDIGVVARGVSRTEYPVLFMNCRSTIVKDCFFGRSGIPSGGPGSASTLYNAVYFGRTNSGVGSTWAARITGNKFTHMGLRFYLQTDSFVLDNEVNCIENQWAMHFDGCDGLMVSRNQIIHKIVYGPFNVSTEVSHNYFDGYFLHDVPYVMHGIEIQGVAKHLRVIGNHFYELPGGGVIRTGSGAVQLASITANSFENCDIFKAGWEDIRIDDTTDSRGVVVADNVHRRTIYYTPDGTEFVRATGDSNRVGPVRLFTSGDGSDEYAIKSIVHGNTAEFNVGYAASAYGSNVRMENNYPTGIWPPSSRWLPFTPALRFGGVAWTPGAASVTGKYSRRGNTATVTVEVTLAADTVIPAGNLFITVPLAAVDVAHGSGRAVIGGYYFGLSTRIGPGETAVQVLHLRDNSNNGVMSNTVPGALATGSVIGFTISYEVA